MNLRFLHILFPLLFLLNLAGFAQESGKPEEKKKLFKDPHKRRFYSNVEIALGLTYIPRNETFGNQRVVVPSIGIEYQHWFYKRIGIILQGEIELGNYFIEFEGDELRRNDLVIAILAVVVEPIERTVIVAGLGNETDQEENFPIIRLGAFYDIPVGNRWNFAPAFYFDYKYAYYTFSFEVGFGYWFGRKPAGDFLIR